MADEDGFDEHTVPRKMVPDLSTMQPKETAPQDGRWFIAYCPDSPMVWAPFEMASWVDFTYAGERKAYFCEQDTSDEIEFDGWWRLPIKKQMADNKSAPGRNALFPDGQPTGSIHPTDLTLDQIELMVRRACAMGRGCTPASIAEILEKVANEVRTWEA
jgi:hypothetical protein